MRISWWVDIARDGACDPRDLARRALHRIAGLYGPAAAREVAGHLMTEVAQAARDTILANGRRATDPRAGVAVYRHGNGWWVAGPTITPERYALYGQACRRAKDLAALVEGGHWGAA